MPSSTTLGTLLLAAVPIGNIADASPRLREALVRADLVCCEDTRVTGKLLAALGLEAKALLRADHHSVERVAPVVLDALRAGQTVLFVSDAGTPGVEDPGGRLVALVVGALPTARIVPLPGPSALMAALSVSGFPAEAFTVFGFLPKKHGRLTRLDTVAQCETTAVLYESPHRLGKTAAALAERCPARLVLLARELTKTHEELWRGTVAELALRYRDTRPKGECMLVLAPRSFSHSLA
jgi:16S rRNA (cytidine1402-2'-O)-methyltransferase